MLAQEKRKRNTRWKNTQELHVERKYTIQIWTLLKIQLFGIYKYINIGLYGTEYFDRIEKHGFLWCVISFGGTKAKREKIIIYHGTILLSAFS